MNEAAQQTSTPSWYKREGMALLTDLYELTMAAGLWKEGRADKPVAFEYFFRSLPPHNGFAITTGLDSFLAYLENLRFLEDDIDYLRTLTLFDDDFLAYLRTWRPRCTVRAIREGTLVFPNEPIVQAEGGMLDTQLLETAVLNFLNFQTLIATKSARICLAAEGEPVLEFGLRRAHGPDGGLSGSRAAYIGGCASTSNTLAGKVYGIPVSGTHAHSWVMSFESEREAFRLFARQYPESCVLLVDTYDTIDSGVPNAIAVIRELRDEGLDVRPAVRLDSGDLARLSKQTYRLMTEAGFEDPMIVASNELDEDLIADLKRQGAKINAWGVGTQLITAFDCPALGGVYKLVAVKEDGGWVPRMKFTSNVEKMTDPGQKNLVRYYDENGAPIGDVMYRYGEDVPDTGDIACRYRTRPHQTTSLRDAARSEALLETVFEDGERKDSRPDVEDIRERTLAQLAALPEEFKRLRNPEVYGVLLSEEAGRLKADLMEMAPHS